MNWNWDNIGDAGARNRTKWVFIPAGSQWRNRAEAGLKVLKSTLSLTLHSSEKLNFCELETLLLSASNAMNERPVAVKYIDQFNFHPLTVNQLLLGRTGTDISRIDYAQAGNALERLEHREELEEVWWKQFYKQVLPSLMPFTKWKVEHPNREVGDVVLVEYPGIMKAEYRMAIVDAVYPDKQGNVRTLDVLMRPRDARTDGKPTYIRKDLEPLTVTVQRTCLIMSKEEVQVGNVEVGELYIVRSGIESSGVSVLGIPNRLLKYTPAFKMINYHKYDAGKQYLNDLKLEIASTQIKE